MARKALSQVIRQWVGETGQSLSVRSNLLSQAISRLASRARSTAYQGAIYAWFRLRVTISKIVHFASILFHAPATVALLVTLFAWSASGRLPKNVSYDWNTIWLALVGIYATALTLIVSLALIPIQRAIEAYGPALARRFTLDQTIKLLFSTLAVGAVTSFVMLAVEIPVKGPIWLLLAPAGLLCIALDTLLWTHRRVARLLDPDHVCDLIVKSASKHHKLTRTTVATINRLRRISSQATCEQYDDALGRSVLMHEKAGFAGLSIRLSEQLMQIALKAVAARDGQSARHATHSIALIATGYLELRKGAAFLLPEHSAIDVLRSEAWQDAKELLEHLKHAGQQSVQDRLELAANGVTDALAEISRFCLNFRHYGEADYECNAVSMPLGYLKNHVKAAQEAHLDDVALHGVYALSSLTASAPANVRITSFWSPLLIGLDDIRYAFLVSPDPLLVNTVLDRQVEIMMDVISAGHFECERLLEDFLSKLASEYPLVLAQIANRGYRSFGTPHSRFYNCTSGKSLYDLLESFASNTTTSDNDERLDRVKAAHEAAVRHMRRLKAGSLPPNWNLLLDLKFTCVEAAKSLLRLASSNTFDEQQQRELGLLIPTWGLALASLGIDHVPCGAAEMELVAEGVAFVGLAATLAGNEDGSLTAARSLRSVIEAWETSTGHKAHDVAEGRSSLFEYGWLLVHVARKTGKDELAERIKTALSPLPESPAEEYLLAQIGELPDKEAWHKEEADLAFLWDRIGGKLDNLNWTDTGAYHLARELIKAHTTLR